MTDAGRDAWLERFKQLHASDVWKETLKAQGWEDAYLSGPDFVSFIKSEEASWTSALKEVGILQ